MKEILLALSIAFTLFSTNAQAWSGYDTTDGAYIEVESYDHKGKGEGEVEYYNYDDGEYHYGYLDMYKGGTGTITDEDGETHEVDMD